MSKNDTRPQTIKQPKRVEVKTALPWTIIVIAIAASVAFIAGWHLHDSAVTMNDVKVIVADQLEEVAATKK